MENMTTNATESTPVGPLLRNMVFLIIYLPGVIGNIIALIWLKAPTVAGRNEKYTFMLRLLAFNDLTALLGMSSQLILKIIFPYIVDVLWYCCLRTIWRSFGLGSGIIVCVMAIEKWILLNKPFFHQIYFTKNFLKLVTGLFWLVGMFFVCLPFLGFGAYYKDGKCVRYKLATEPIDKAYAFVFFTFGIILSFAILYSNLSAVKLIITKQITTNRNDKNAIKEERKFVKLMWILSGVFVTTWLPQLSTIPLLHLYPVSKFLKYATIIADVGFSLHFVLNPYIYIFFGRSNDRLNTSCDSETDLEISLTEAPVTMPEDNDN